MSEMDIEILEDGKKYGHVNVVWQMIEESEEFANFFYFVATIDELQNLKYLEDQVFMTSGLHSVFYALKADGYELSEIELSRVTNMHRSWDSETKKRLIKFYKAYHAKLGRNETNHGKKK